jgi:hypothetical protein
MKLMLNSNLSPNVCRGVSIKDQQPVWENLKAHASSDGSNVDVYILDTDIDIVIDLEDFGVPNTSRAIVLVQTRRVRKIRIMG